MPGTFSPPPRISDPDMHQGTCVTHVPWCMSGSLTSGFLWNRWRGKRSRHSRRMPNLQFYVSGKRPMGLLCGALAFYLLTAWTNCLSSRFVCDLRRHCDVIIRSPFNRVRDQHWTTLQRCHLSWGVSDHRQHESLFIGLFGRTRMKTAKLRITDPLWGEWIGDQWIPLIQSL